MKAGARRLVVLGGGGHARAVADLALECGWTMTGFTERAGSVAGADVIGDDDRAVAVVRAGGADGAVVGIGNTALARRAELFRLLQETKTFAPTLMHPRAVASRSCQLGAGTVVFANAVLGAHVEVGDNVVLYSGVIAEHDCRIAAHAYLAPGVILSGSVTIEEGAFVGSGAVVLPGVRIGRHAVVAAGAVVTADVPAGDTVIGAPARSHARRS